MKKIFYFISVIVLLSACKEELEGIVPEVNVPEGTQKVELPEVIYATMADEQNDEDTVKTRTYVGLDGRSVLWHGGDAICYCADHVLDSKYVLKGDGGVSSAEFAHENTVQTSTYPVPFSLGVYPYDSNLTPSYGNKGQLGEYNPEYDQEAYPPYCFIDVTYPATQTYAPNSFGRGANMMVAVGKNSTDENLYFKNANGFLVIQLYGVDSSVKSITLRANTSTDYLSGWAGMEIYSDGNFNISKWNENNRSNTVTLDCNNGGEGVKINADKQSSTDFWFALPPMTLNGGFEVEVTDMNDLTYSMKTTQDVEIRRKEVKRMAAFRVEQTAPMPNQIWYTQAPEVTTPTTFNVSKPFGDDVNIVGQTYNEERGIFVIQLDKPVTQIVNNAFRGNEGIKDVILPEGLVTIGNSAFKFSSLKSIIIPGTVTLIGEDTFYGCSNLEEVHFQQGSTLTINAICQVPDASTPQLVGPFYHSPLKIINLNRNIKYPDAMYESHYTEGIFAENSSVTGNVATTINIGSNVTTLPEYIFAGSDLTSITIPGSVESIGNNAFEMCTSLTSVTFEPSTAVNPNLSLGYQDLSSDKGPFFNSPLTYIYLDRQIEYIYDDLDYEDEGVFVNQNTYLIKNEPSPATVTLGSHVEAIHDWMFYGVPITKITIPENVTDIGLDAFANNSQLTTVTCEGTNIIPRLNGKPFGNNAGLRIYVPSSKLDSYKYYWSQYGSSISKITNQ